MTQEERILFIKKKLIILNNEVHPRERKYGSKIDMKLIDPLIMLEFRKQINRQQLKTMLDDLFKVSNGK